MLMQMRGGGRRILKKINVGRVLVLKDPLASFSVKCRTVSLPRLTTTCSPPTRLYTPKLLLLNDEEFAALPLTRALHSYTFRLSLGRFATETTQPTVPQSYKECSR